MVWMKSRWTPTRCAPKSSTAATEKQRMPLIPTAARRWLIRRVSGWPSRQASKNRAAQATASAISANRTACSALRSETSQNANSWCSRGDQAGSRRSTSSSANQIRSAIRPTRRLPHASCAEPGQDERHRHQRQGPAEPHRARRGAVELLRGSRAIAAKSAPEGKIRCAGPVSPVTGVTRSDDAPKPCVVVSPARVRAREVIRTEPRLLCPYDVNRAAQRAPEAILDGGCRPAQLAAAPVHRRR